MSKILSYAPNSPEIDDQAAAAAVQAAIAAAKGMRWKKAGDGFIGASQGHSAVASDTSRQYCAVTSHAKQIVVVLPEAEAAAVISAARASLG